MIKIPLNPYKWFESLSDSIESLYKHSFNNSASSILEKTVDELLITNFTLWGYEDNARRTDLPDKEIAGLKRKIDGENQKRHNLMDNIDALFREDLEEKLKTIDRSLPLNSETPASILDRLTILALRSYHLKKETERKDADKSHIERCSCMLKEVKERSEDLLNCIEQLLIDYYTSKKKLKAYHQHKLYNDPSLNPTLRK